MQKFDPIIMSVLVNNLSWITEEMNEYLAKSAFSTNIKVRRDCSCTLYTKDGEMISQGEFVPSHLGVMSNSLKEVLKDIPINSIEKGDVIIHNDPYKMGAHLWDIMLFRPIFYKDEIILFAGNIAHHIDIGGSPTKWDSPTIFEEGLRLPPIKLYRKGRLQEDVLKIITTNVRTPYEVRGDIAAQTAANYRAELRIIELVKKYGQSELQNYFDAILDYSEKGMRKLIEDAPDSESTFEDYIENDGIEDILIKIKVKVNIKGSDVYLDFEGSGSPGKGGVNSPWSLTNSAVYYAMKTVFGAKIPTNNGAYRPIHIKRNKEESIVDARFPHAVGGCTCTPAQRIVDVVIGALSKILPEKVCACDGHWAADLFVGIDPRTGRYSSFIETYACGRGAKYNDDGADAHQTHMTNTANAPIEIIELEHPLRIDKYALIQDSGGAGKFRGGLGLTREITCLAPMAASARQMRPKIKPYGLFGGKGGANDLCGVILPNSEITQICKEVKAGYKVIIRTSGGGGWGEPLERDINKLEWDVLNGYVSLNAAKEDYKCIIDPKNYKIDIKKTNKLRKIKNILLKSKKY